VSGDVPDGFRGARVAVLESRLAEETAAIIRRLDGEPVSAPAVMETDVEADGPIADVIDQLGASADRIVVLLTGVAVTRMFAVADRLGRAGALRDGLNQSIVVARGPKPAGALARRGVSRPLAVPEPFTTADVIATLDTVRVEGRPATVIHYGERNEAIVASLASRGADVRELTVYEWRLPEDVGPLVSVIDRLLAGEIPILALTSQVQLRHLLAVAGARREALVAALNRHVIVGAVGPTCAAACADAGIAPVVVPERPKLMPLFHALAAATARSSRIVSPKPS
jgi:uroporphyrinogen-III synthase